MMTLAAGSVYRMETIVKAISFDAESNAMYAPPGYLLFTRESTLLAQRFNAERLELSGEAVPVAEGISVDAAPRPRREIRVAS